MLAPVLDAQVGEDEGLRQVLDGQGKHAQHGEKNATVHRPCFSLLRLMQKQNLCTKKSSRMIAYSSTPQQVTNDSTC